MPRKDYSPKTDLKYYRILRQCCRRLIEQRRPLLGATPLPRPLVIRIPNDQRHGQRCLAEDHLFVNRIHLTPTARFLERAARERAVAHVGDGDLHGVLMHRGVFVGENLGGDDDVLGEILRNPPADHEQAGVSALELELRELVKILAAVDADLWAVGARVLVGDDAEAARAVSEGGDEDRDIFLVGFQDNAVGRLAVAGKIRAHLADDLPRAVGARLELIEDLLRRLIADAQLFFVDERVVDAVDHQLAKLAVARAALEFVGGDVVLVAEAFEEILIDDVGAGGDDRIDHVIADHVHEDFLEAGADERAGETKDYAALFVLEHAVVDVGGAVQVAGRESHVLHGIDDRDDVLLRDVNVLDGLLEIIFLGCH